MRKIKIFADISLDGYILRTNGENLCDKEGNDKLYKKNGFYAFLESVDIVLMNKRLFALFEQYQYTNSWKNKTFCIVSNTIFTTALTDNVCFITTGNEKNASIEEQIGRLKKEKGGDIWLAGDNELIATLTDCRLIDEITFNVIPKTIGNGLHFFEAHNNENQWKMIASKRLDNDVVQIKYFSDRGA